ncbi:hypothetical protein GH714_003261 [Hevea brasiliensis]|uniref:Carbamoyl phosphate synthase ATP-binding domain-containing protein n=1 Tax=Hevea brasiliensis TaxID=3981 RepID=A0A6A6NC27_HEVBR|nr:hypothetical protein GH714_003261 [Hevea brasiliensis]
MISIVLKTPPSGVGNTLDECIEIANEIGEFPFIDPRLLCGGEEGIAYNKEEFQSICKAGLAASLTSQVLVEKSLLGLKEYELEVMRDLADNVVIICFIENIDPMGVHTGDSIMVAPAQTLTDKKVSRSSALASKATGFPIAKMAAKLSIGYSLGQIPNDIKKKTPASF